MKTPNLSTPIAIAGGLGLAAVVERLAAETTVVVEVLACFLLYGSVGAILAIVEPSKGVRWLYNLVGPPLAVSLVIALLLQTLVGLLGDAPFLLSSAAGVLIGLLIAGRGGSATTAETQEDPDRTEFHKVSLKSVLDAGLEKNNKDSTDRIKQMIDYAIGRVDYYDDLRHRHLTIALGLLAGSIAFATLLTRLPSSVPPSSLILAALGALVGLVTSAIVVYVYSRTSAMEYPHHPIADIRSWYFHYSIPPDQSLELSDDPKTQREQAKNVVTIFTTFLQQWLEYAKEKGRFVAEDLEQVFILYVIQQAKRNAVKRMTSISAFGLLGTAVFIAAAVIVWLVTVLWLH